MIPICRNIQNDEAYEYLGGTRFRNVRTGNEGDVDEKTARKIFKFNLDATQLFNEYPLVRELISKLNLKFDNIKNLNK